MDTDELSAKQEKLAALNQILEAYNANKKTDLHLEPVSFTEMHGTEFINNGQSAIRQQQRLYSLATEGLIEIKNYQSFLGIHIFIKDLPAVIESHKILSDSIPAQGNLPRILYSIKTGRGKIDGKEFRFYRNSDNRKLFKKLVTAPQYRLSRSDAWKSTGRRTTVRDAVAVSELSRLVSKLRAGLHAINTENLDLNKESVQLIADLKLTDKNR